MEQDDLFFSPFHKALKVEKMNRRYYDLGKGKYVLLKK